jgi:hypothetical protein
MLNPAQASPPNASAGTSVLFSSQQQLCDGDYIEVRPFQNSGGALNTSGDGNTTLSFSRVW